MHRCVRSFEEAPRLEAANGYVGGGTDAKQTVTGPKLASCHLMYMSRCANSSTLPTGDFLQELTGAAHLHFGCHRAAVKALSHLLAAFEAPPGPGLEERHLGIYVVLRAREFPMAAR